MDNKEVFKIFIEKNDVLIVDKNPSSRNRLLKIMADLGYKRNKIHSVGSITECEEILETKQIGIVLSEYLIGGGSGFDLFKLIRSKPQSNPKMSLILVTSNMSQSAVAKAAEEDVDSFVIKPFTLQSINETLVATVAEKVQPPKYILAIEKGKSLIAAGQYDDAIKLLTVAKKMHKAPALALFYIGQAEYLQSLQGKAQDTYQQGLALNEIHYKCLIGLFELLKQGNNNKEAYAVMKKVTTYFPANSDRLMQAIRLAVVTNSFPDMLDFYQIFTELEDRSETLIKFIGAGLYVSGKFSIQKKNTEAALKCFEGIAVSCSSFTICLRSVVTVLAQNSHGEEAEKFLMRFPADQKSSEDYLISDYLVTSVRITDLNVVVKEGLALFNKNVRDYDCLMVMINAMKKLGYSDEKIAPYQAEADKSLPAQAA